MNDQELAKRILYRIDLAGYLNVHRPTLAETQEKISEATQVVLNVLRERAKKASSQ